jgi:glycosyltransferase involved in cell wall biosynthesis
MSRNNIKSSRPRVSVIIIFLDAEMFIIEAIESVLAQTFSAWELLLVDDGSRDKSTEIAKLYATKYSNKVHYLEHPCHSNLGKGASRNLGIYHASGDYLAFLDADDIWLPNKLEEQVAILDKHEMVGMLYGDSLYWYSWAQDSTEKRMDFKPTLRVPLNIPIPPPTLLPLYLRGKVTVPCPCSILVRRSIINEIGGFDETFTGINNIYEDQSFYAKICLKTPILAVNRCWDYYRQHAHSSMSVALQTGKEVQARKFFLNWLKKYLGDQNILDNEIWMALHRELWRIEKPNWLPKSSEASVRWVKKWLLRIDEHILPNTFRYLLWLRE